MLTIGFAAAGLAPGGDENDRDGGNSRGTSTQEVTGMDEFGVRHLLPTLPDGISWVSRWTEPRSFDGVDPKDPWFDADHGSGTYVAGGGELEISGRAPRMYVHDPERRHQWGDVEITVYAQRVADSAIPYAGITAVARSNHLQTEDGSSDICDTRGYGGRLRFDGHADLEKETAHPHNDAIANAEVFPGPVPTGIWIGMKFLVFDRPDGVHLELWVDLSDGAEGGQWRLVTSAIDDGALFGMVPCAPGIDAEMALDNATMRAGSESGRPNLSVYFRSDGIGPAGLVYKWASIREIQPRAECPGGPRWFRPGVSECLPLDGP